MSFSDRINELFNDNPKKTNAALAKFLKVTRTSPTDWRSGKAKSITPENGFGIAEFFGANPEWVMLGKGKKYKHTPHNGINENNKHYDVTAKTEKEKTALKLLNNMANFQQDDWLKEGQAKADEHQRHINASEKPEGKEEI